MFSFFSYKTNDQFISEYNNYSGSGVGFGNSPNFSVPPPNFQNSSSGYASENQGSNSWSQSQSGGKIQIVYYLKFNLVIAYNKKNF